MVDFRHFLEPAITPTLSNLIRKTVILPIYYPKMINAMKNVIL